MTMRPRLGALLLALVLAAPIAGCGEDAGDGERTAEDPATSTPATSTPATTDLPTDVTTAPTPEPSATTGSGGLVTILSGTAAGGETGAAFRLDVPASLDRFLRQFERGSLAGEIRATVSGIRLREGQSLWGRVVAIGCDVPPTAYVAVEDGEVTIVPGKVASPMEECFAPVTSVAIAVVVL